MQKKGAIMQDKYIQRSNVQQVTVVNNIVLNKKKKTKQSDVKNGQKT